jgi:3-hydroxyisobutyrate dehydrogenase
MEVDMKTGFIGFGTLGTAIATRLIEQGIELIGWNRTPGKAENLGVRVADSPADLVSQVDAVILNLFDSDSVQAVLLGNEGLLEGDAAGKLIIDTTTNHFEPVIEFARLCKEKGADYIESPVLGSVGPALKGVLTVAVSGEKSAYDRALPLIQKFGKAIFYLGEPGLATRMKLVNNLVLGSLMAALGEAVALGESAGIDKEKVIEVLAAGAGNSVVLNGKKEKLLKEDFSTQFSAALMYKDLHFVQDLARKTRRPLFTASVAKELFAMTFPRELDQMDFSVVYRVVGE